MTTVNPITYTAL